MMEENEEGKRLMIKAWSPGRSIEDVKFGEGEVLVGCSFSLSEDAPPLR